MKGIMFRPAMNLAIRENRKPETRRIELCLAEINKEPDAFLFRGMNKGVAQFSHNGGNIYWSVKPRYQVGETVYVKEAWAYGAKDQHPTGVIYRLDGTQLPTALQRGTYSVRSAWGKWASSLFMPQEAARTFIKILDVKPQRLKTMTPADAVAEGFNSLIDFVAYYASQMHLDAWERNDWAIAYKFEMIK